MVSFPALRRSRRTCRATPRTFDPPSVLSGGRRSCETNWLRRRTVQRARYCRAAVPECEAAASTHQPARPASGRMSATEQCARCSTAWLTDPSNSPVNPSRPREPTTTRLRTARLIDERVRRTVAQDHALHPARAARRRRADPRARAPRRRPALAEPDLTYRVVLRPLEGRHDPQRNDERLPPQPSALHAARSPIHQSRRPPSDGGDDDHALVAEQRLAAENGR
jgi:hypothetical protein